MGQCSNQKELKVKSSVLLVAGITLLLPCSNQKELKDTYRLVIEPVEIGMDKRSNQKELKENNIYSNATKED